MAEDLKHHYTHRYKHTGLHSRINTYVLVYLRWLEVWGVNVRGEGSQGEGCLEVGCVMGTGERKAEKVRSYQ